MRAHPREVSIQDVERMDRKELVSMLLEFNDYSTFCFTRKWLERQRTKRLQVLLREKVLLAQGLMPFNHDPDEVEVPSQQTEKATG